MTIDHRLDHPIDETNTAYSFSNKTIVKLMLIRERENAKTS